MYVESETPLFVNVAFLGKKQSNHKFLKEQFVIV